MEERDELMVTETTELASVEDTVEEESSSGVGTGLAMLIGSGLTLAVIAGGMKLRKVWRIRRAERELRDMDAEMDDYVEDEEDEDAE